MFPAAFTESSFLPNNWPLTCTNSASLTTQGKFCNCCINPCSSSRLRRVVGTESEPPWGLKQTQQTYNDKLDAFKCNLKKLTTKSALSAWGQWSLACLCPVAGYIDHVIHWHDQLSFMLGSFSHFLPPPPPFLPLGFVVFFSTDVFSVPFLWCGDSWLGCTVVPVMGALFQSRGWLPIVEAPGYSRHPTLTDTVLLEERREEGALWSY